MVKSVDVWYAWNWSARVIVSHFSKENKKSFIFKASHSFQCLPNWISTQKSFLVRCLVPLNFTAIKSVMKHHGGSVFGKKQMPGVETHHLRQSFETEWKSSLLLSLYKNNRREQIKSYLVLAFKSSHSWCLISTQNAAHLEILLPALFPQGKSA